ncbi:hypothetical protein LP419_27410 [Massilia sp. H-1]|nr:hypothetical protein LP419_27410 [Massilia sp. H-1]
MSWTRSAALTRGADGVWTYTWPDSMGLVTIKPVLGAHKVSTGGTYRLAAKQHGRHLSLLRRAVRQGDDGAGLRLAAAGQQPPAAHLPAAKLR